MSGPVWRWDKDQQATCDLCLAEVTGAFVEGHVVDGEFVRKRQVCQSCFRAFRDFLVDGETEGKAAAPAYAHR